MLDFVKQVFSENGQGSYSRSASGIIVASVIAWVSYVVFRSHTIPDLTGPAAFLTTGVGVHYGTNKAPDILTAILNRKDK
jgi:hypothetical protein